VRAPAADAITGQVTVAGRRSDAAPLDEKNWTFWDKERETNDHGAYPTDAALALGWPAWRELSVLARP
jgi:hypothetical protein